MPIIRGKLGLVDNFTQIPNDWLRDPSLSLKSKGLLAQLASHSEGWQVTIRSLADPNGCGLDYIRTAVNELEEAGYLRREQRRKPNSQFGEVVWITQQPTLDYPITEKPISEKPITENPTLKNNNVKNTNLKKTINKYFNEFWEAYPRKVGRGYAEKAFSKAIGANLTEAEAIAEQIVEGCKKLASDPNLPEPAFIPHPSTWLNREGWLDEPYPEQKLTKELQLEKDRLDAQLKRKREREETEKVLEEMNNYKSEPAPRCEHDKIVAMCYVCSKQLANE